VSAAGVPASGLGVEKMRGIAGRGHRANIPAHVAAAWLGHSTVVVSKHYWQVTDDNFAKAVGAQPQAAQNPAQQAHAGGRSNSHATAPAHEKAPVIPSFATSRETLQYRGMGDEGLEPPTSTV
jgi:hypothetical protein